MHIIFLGVALHFLACCIWELINTDVFGAGSIKVKLEKAWEHMKSWVRAHGLACSQSRFTRASLQIRDSYSYPEPKAKAHNARVMMG